LKICRDQFGKKYSLNICGETFVPSDIAYKEKLLKMVEDFSLTDQVHFSGMVTRAEMPRKLQESKVFFFLTKGGVGKATLESIACGVPVLISEPNANDFFGDELSQWFLCERDSDSVAAALIKLMDAPAEKYRELSAKAHSLFKEKYTMEKFVDRIVTTINQELFKEPAARK
jgi:glycosyltransferase involved in cell wall biosynthesis